LAITFHVFVHYLLVHKILLLLRQYISYDLEVFHVKQNYQATCQINDKT
jgi:hypothetical protein